MHHTIQPYIGIYGGGFDPVHNTHLSIARRVTQFLNLSTLIWVPTGVAWHKASTLSAPKDRVRMLELAFQQEPASLQSRWKISSFEIEQLKNSYTIETLSFLQSEQSKFYNPDAKWFFIMGADQLTLLHTWKDWEQLASRVTFAVVERQGVDLNDIDSSVRKLAQWVIVPSEISDLSSSCVRDLVKQMSQQDQNGQIRGKLLSLMPEDVLNYICDHRLYL